MYDIMKSFRSLKALLPEELEAVYKTHTIKEIEYIFNCDISVLYRLLDLYKIPRRFPKLKYASRDVMQLNNKKQDERQLERGIKILDRRCSEII
jgi:hypothetical protein